MEKVTIGRLFDQFGSANEIVDELIDRGFKRNQISIASEANTYKKHTRPKSRSSSFKSVNIRQVGLAMAAGPVAKEVAPSGDLRKWLEEAGMPKRTSQKVLTAMRKGRTLVVLQVNEHQAEDALEFFSGTHGSGGEIGGFVPGDLVVASKSRAFHRNLNPENFYSEPPAPEESGTRGSGGSIDD